MEVSMQRQADEHHVDLCTSSEALTSENPVLHQCSDKEDKCTVCRVCQCLESDRRGDAALALLNIIPPCLEGSDLNAKDERASLTAIEEDLKGEKKDNLKPCFSELVSPDGEVFVCSNDIETGSSHQEDALVNLGCLCKGDLALAHYACALKWFINHGSTICEICGTVARNIRPEDFKKVSAALKDYEALRERTAMGEPTHVCLGVNSGVDPDAVAAVRRVRLSEITSWFNPQINSSAVSQNAPEQSSTTTQENATTSESLTAKWAVEGTGILVATGLLTVTLAWLIAPRVGKKTARSGLHILLGGICALTVVIFLRLVVLSRIKYGPARYWAILFVFWFLVFGIWASRSHSSHSA